MDLLVVKGTLKSLIQHHSSKASILQCSAFFIIQLSHPYMTTGKTLALTRRTFVGKVMSLLFNTLSRFVIAFLPRSKCLLISWFQSPSTVILEPKKIWQHSFSVFIWALPVVVMVVGCMSCSLGASASSLSLVAQLVKNLLVIQVNEVRSLGREEPLEKGMATHSSILAGEFHGQRSLAGYCPGGSQRVGQD